jgi:hypothetical protein
MNLKAQVPELEADPATAGRYIFEWQTASGQLYFVHLDPPDGTEVRKGHGELMVEDVNTREQAIMWMNIWRHGLRFAKSPVPLFKHS